ncbi:MAG: 2'-5' RNA ligase family protein [Eubacteriales bacterium]|nr:2'-5' RNA ligase family protein [Eubacteriales bacterium]MDD3867811.1 2'-5' RNA ligase family protein [Eubacteriales bacterium]MDD4462158.1 2'-5' RNA ligase family protein [Eubacteriales bacterium]
MDYAILVYFDAAAEATLNRWISRLVDGGVSPAYQKTGMRPHLTIAEVDTSDYEAIKACVEDLSEHLPDLSVKLASVGFFPNDEGVLFLAPIVDEPLLEFHRTVNTALEPLSDAFSPLYLENNWVPHCTLALGMKADEFSIAYQTLQAVFEPVEVKISGISIVKCCPYQETLVCPINA